jgi:hypothetical protein
MSYAILKHNIKCAYSGLQIGTLEVQTTAGIIPYLSHWEKCVAHHPVFAMNHGKLLQLVSDEWKRLAERASDFEVTEEESNILRVGFLAVLHALGSIKQDGPGLPSLATVCSQLPRLFHLAYWKYRLESNRFKFPMFHIARINMNERFENIGGYFDVCFDIKADYEKSVREAEEQEKVRIAEKAVIALNSSWATPVSKRLLWQWIKAHLPEKYAADAEGWLSTLFLGGSAAIIEFEEEDLELAEEIIVSSCPQGTGVLSAVRKRLEQVRSIWEQHNAAFSIDLEDFAGPKLFVNGVEVATPHPGEEPTLQGCEYNRSKFMVAHAKWTIAKRAWEQAERKKGGN